MVAFKYRIAAPNVLASLKDVEDFDYRTLGPNALASLKTVNKGFYRIAAANELASLKQFWPVFNGPYNYNFTASQRWTWPFPAEARVKATLTGGQGGEGRAEAVTSTLYWASSGEWGPEGNSALLGQTTANTILSRMLAGTGTTAGQRVPPPTTNGGNPQIGIRYVSMGTTGLGTGFRIAQNYGTPERQGGAGTNSVLTIGSNTYTGPGNAGGRGSLPAIPSAVEQIITGVEEGTAASIGIGAGGAGNGGSTGASGSITLQVVDSEGNDFNGPGLPDRGSMPVPPTPHHTLQMTAGSSGSTIGLNTNFGSVTSGQAFTTPGSISATIRMCRLLGSRLVFTMSGSGLSASSLSEFPARIVSKRDGQTDVVAIRPSSLRSISSGIRGDYTIESGDLAAMYTNGASITVELYY